MMPVRRILIGLAASMAAMATLTVVDQPAQADEIAVRDGDDERRGALDLRKVTMGHYLGTFSPQILVRIQTRERFSSVDLDPAQRTLGVAFDLDDDPSDAERFLFMYGARGVFRGVFTNDRGDRLSSRVFVHHPNRTTVVARFFPGQLGGPDGYRWFAFASSDINRRCCVDAAPNRGWINHDLTGPMVDDLNFGVPDFEIVRGTRVPMSFNVWDLGGSPSIEWAAYIRGSRAPERVEVARGTTSGVQEAMLELDEGSLYSVCVNTRDSAGNVGGNSEYIVVPMDDAGFAFSDGWSTDQGSPLDFQGTRHVSSTPGASFSFDLPPERVTDFILPGGYDGVARVFVNGQDAGTVRGSTNPDVHRARVSSRIGFFDQPGTTSSIRVVVESGTFAVDGFAGFPSGGSIPSACEGGLAPSPGEIADPAVYSR